MTVNLGDRFEQLLTELIASGRFQNQEEVIRAGLRLLEDREYGYDEALEAELVKRLDSPSTPWTKADLAKIRKLGRASAKRTRLKSAA
jgi:putative addiction module CopG family antidote